MSICAFPCDPCSREVEFGDQRLHAIVAHRRCVRIECVGFDDVGAGVQKSTVNVLDYTWARNRQQVVIALQVLLPVPETIAPEVVLIETKTLNHRAHGAVQEQNPLG